ncbi:hypothetical protein D9M69_504540 [compost metagenome]
MPGHQLGVDHAVARGQQEACEPGQRAREHEGRELVAVHRKAGGAHALLVHADARERRAEARAADERQQAVGEHQRRQHHVEQHCAVLHVERAEGGAHVQVDAVAAAADLGVVEHEEGHLRKGQRDHDEIHAARAQAQRTDEQRIQRRRAHRQHQQHREVAALVARGQHGDVRADAVEGRVAQAHEPGHAHQQLQAEREDRQDHHLDDEVRRVVAQQRTGHGEGDGAQHGNDEGAAPRRRRHRRNHGAHGRLPIKPSGFQISTMAISR